MQSACLQHLADTELSAGHPDAALRALLQSDALLSQFGERSFRSTAQALIAKVHTLLGNRAAAEAAVDLAEELGAPEDVINYAITHSVRAWHALEDNDPAAAERWARSAVSYADQTDFTAIRGEAKLDLARVLAELGRREGAATEARNALDLYESKPDQPAAAQARTVLAELEKTPS
jgi:tetratricopeptide (TPR) repeat protein